YDAEVTGEVRRADAQDADQLVAHLLGEVEQLRVGQLVEVRRRVDLRKQSGHGVVLNPLLSVDRPVAGATGGSTPKISDPSPIALQNPRNQCQQAITLSRQAF